MGFRLRIRDGFSSCFCCGCCYESPAGLLNRGDTQTNTVTHTPTHIGPATTKICIFKPAVI